VASKTQKLADLAARIQANVDANNTELAAQLASQHESLEQDLNHDKQSLADTEKAYQTSLTQMKMTQQEFQRKIDALQSKMSQTQIAEAQAEAGSALQNVSFSAADIGDTMKSVEEGLDKRYEKAAGKARLITDLGNSTDVVAKESEQKALDKAALAKFLAKKSGGVPATATPAPVAEKQMGPAVGN
jgi:phage shock protein A